MDDIEALSTRAKTIIKRAKLKTPEEIRRYPNDKFLQIKGCGLSALEDIRKHFPYEEDEELSLGREFELVYQNPDQLAIFLAKNMTAEQLGELMKTLIDIIIIHG